MRIKILIEDQYTIAAVMQKDECPVQDALVNGYPNYEACSNGLLDMICRIAENGFKQFSSKQCHLINKDKKIYELIRGRLRLIFFHGKNKTIMICTEVVVKDTQKTDRKVVNRALKIYDDYYNSLQKDTLIETRDEDENE